MAKVFLHPRRAKFYFAACYAEATERSCLVGDPFGVGDINFEQAGTVLKTSKNRGSRRQN